MRFEGTMNTDKYKQFLVYHGILSARRPIGDKFIFQHDNGHKHSAKDVKTYCCGSTRPHASKAMAPIIQ